MRALVVVNPNATTTSERTRDVLLSALGNDMDLDVVATTHRDHATDLGRQAREKRFELVVAVGGDGTINELVNGVLDGGGDGDLPDLAIVPGGSTNVLARNLGIPENPVEATGLLLDALRTGRRHPLGLGRLDQRYFTFAAGFGLDADVIRAVEEARTAGRKATPALYVRTALRRYFAQRNRRHGSITLEAPGIDPVTGVAVAIISNCSPWTYLGNLPLRPTPQADFNAGLDVFGLTSLGLLPTLSSVAQMATRHNGTRGRRVVTLHNQATLTLRSPVPLPAQVDGDYIGERETITLTSIPDAVRVAF
ncbi:diacylglycerol/lipid kinase family protein [Phytoactinopolyspora halotolerans]|uniref:Diacylglycerol kinase family lipid kinase n=1 Tax=Phytoactinopolyspora halotolerans TaxID=1981512 RepID=A0A6L9SDB1_9ACTN|nr:diacylglycerol kinase family protein [Phytoactinopolyspora halotolerans]NEE02552.1 diacylglycerol kinase family lipid kinase [Phytoactinopolyspora halotolerans]